MAQFAMIAFAGFILSSWANEIFDLPYLMERASATPANYYETAIETLWVFFVMILMLISTRALLKQIRYLEGFLPVC